MEPGFYKPSVWAHTALFCLLWTLPAMCQESPAPLEVPDKFDLDLKTAARLRPRFLAESSAASGRYEVGHLVFERLITQLQPPNSRKHSWELRILDDDLLNAFASPEGTIYVARGLAQLAGPSTGLWAAILSHEIAHVVRRDWARRYLYEQSLRQGSTLVLGDSATPAGTWADTQSTSAAFAQFCRQMELDADLASLMMMARAGYHPDFAAALHHLMHSESLNASGTSPYAMHPRWEQRDRDLQRAYVDASLEFGHRWPEWYASPGGNPPIVVFEQDPRVKKNGSDTWEIQVPLRCQNLAGAVEVVVRSRGNKNESRSRDHSAEQLSSSGQEIRQLTGCTSPITTVTFTITREQKLAERWTDVYVLDAWGTVLSRADLPKLHR